MTEQLFYFFRQHSVIKNVELQEKVIVHNKYDVHHCDKQQYRYPSPFGKFRVIDTENLGAKQNRKEQRNIKHRKPRKKRQRSQLYFFTKKWYNIK